MIHHGDIFPSFSSRSNVFTRRTVSAIDLCDDLVAIGSQDGNIELLLLTPLETRQHVTVLAHIILPASISDGLNHNVSEYSRREHNKHNKAISCIRISSCQCKLAFGTALGEIFVFDIENIHASRLIGSHNDHKGFAVTGLCWSPNTDLLFSGCSSGRVVEWKPEKSKYEETISFGWAKSILGFRSGNVLYLSSSAISKIEIAIKSGSIHENESYDYQSSLLKSYLLLISTGNQTILLDIQRNYLGNGKWDSVVNKTVNIGPSIAGTLSSAASAFSYSLSTTNKVSRASGFISCRKGDSSGPEFLFCDIEGEHYQTFNLKFISNQLTEQVTGSSYSHIYNSKHLSHGSSLSESSKSIVPFGFKYAMSSDVSGYKNLLFVITDNKQLCVIDKVQLVIQFFPFFNESAIVESIAISRNKLLVLSRDESNDQDVGSIHISLYEMISQSLISLPIIIFNSSVYRAIVQIQRQWRRNSNSTAVWRNVNSPNPVLPKIKKQSNDISGSNVSTSSQSSNYHDEDEFEENDVLSDLLYQSSHPSRYIDHVKSSSVSEDLNNCHHDKLSSFQTQIDRVDSMIEKALMQADSEVETAVFDEKNQILLFSNFFSGSSGLNWNIDNIAENGLPITTDERGKVRSLPVNIVEQLQSLHNCVLEKENNLEQQKLNHRKKLLLQIYEETSSSISTSLTIHPDCLISSELSPSSHSTMKSLPSTRSTTSTIAIEDRFIMNHLNESSSHTSSWPHESNHILHEINYTVDMTMEANRLNDLMRSMDNLLQTSMILLDDSIDSERYKSFDSLMDSHPISPSHGFVWPISMNMESLSMAIDHVLNDIIHHDINLVYDTLPNELKTNMNDFIAHDDSSVCHNDRIVQSAVDIVNHLYPSNEADSLRESIESPLSSSSETMYDTISNISYKPTIYQLYQMTKDDYEDILSIASTNDDICDIQLHIVHSDDDGDRECEDDCDSSDENVEFIRKSEDTCWLDSYWWNANEYKTKGNNMISVKDRITSRRVAASHEKSEDSGCIRDNLIELPPSPISQQVGRGNILFDEFPCVDISTTQYTTTRMRLSNNDTREIEKTADEPFDYHKNLKESHRSDRIINNTYNLTPLDMSSSMTYDVVLYAPNGLGISLFITSTGQLFVKSFRKLLNGQKGPVELYGLISLGDELIGINGIQLEGLGLEQLAELLESTGLSGTSIGNQRIQDHMMRLTLRYGFDNVLDELLNDHHQSQSYHVDESNPLFDLFGPMLSVNIGNVLDSSDDSVSSNHRDDDYNSPIDEPIFLRSIIKSENSWCDYHPIHRHVYADISASQLYPNIFLDLSLHDQMDLQGDKLILRDDIVNQLQYWMDLSRRYESSYEFIDSKYSSIVSNSETNINHHRNHHQTFSLENSTVRCNDLMIIDAHSFIDRLKGDYELLQRSLSANSQRIASYSFLFTNRSNYFDEKDEFEVNYDHDDESDEMVLKHQRNDCWNYENQMYENLLEKLQQAKNKYQNRSLRQYLHQNNRHSSSNDVKYFVPSYSNNNNMYDNNNMNNNDNNNNTKVQENQYQMNQIHQFIRKNLLLSSTTIPSNPFGLFPIPSITIQPTSDIGIYLPEYQCTIQLLIYLLTIVDNFKTQFTNQSNIFRGQILDNYDITSNNYNDRSNHSFNHLVELLSIWMDIFVPLPIQYRHKLWSDSLNRSQVYSNIHGFPTSHDMNDYIRLVNDFITLYFGLKSCGRIILETMIQNYEKFISNQSMNTNSVNETANNQSNSKLSFQNISYQWAKFFPSGYILNHSAIHENLIESDDSSNFIIWSDNLMCQNIKNYLSYLNIDILIHYCNTKQSIQCLKEILFLTNQELICSNISLFIQHYLHNNNNTSNNLSNQLLSSKIFLQLLFQKNYCNEMIIYCGIIQNLGPLFRHDEKFAIDLVIQCYPIINPWIMKYILFGDDFHQVIIINPFELTSKDTFIDKNGQPDECNYKSPPLSEENNGLSQWYHQARRIYEKYLQLIHRRYRYYVNHSSFILEWFELLCFLATNQDSNVSRDIHMIKAIDEGYYSLITAIIHHPDIYQYNFYEIMVLCYEYGFPQEFMDCLSSLITQLSQSSSSSPSPLPSTSALSSHMNEKKSNYSMESLSSKNFDMSQNQDEEDKSVRHKTIATSNSAQSIDMMTLAGNKGQSQQQGRPYRHRYDLDGHQIDRLHKILNELIRHQLHQLHCDYDEVSFESSNETYSMMLKLLTLQWCLICCYPSMAINTVNAMRQRHHSDESHELNKNQDENEDDSNRFKEMNEYIIKYLQSFQRTSYHTIVSYESNDSPSNHSDGISEDDKYIHLRYDPHDDAVLMDDSIRNDHQAILFMIQYIDMYWKCLKSNVDSSDSPPSDLANIFGSMLVHVFKRSLAMVMIYWCDDLIDHLTIEFYQWLSRTS